MTENTVDSEQTEPDMWRESKESVSEEIVTGKTPSNQSVSDQTAESISGSKPSNTNYPADIVNTQSSFYTYENMMEDLDLLSKKYVGLMSVGVVGTTADNRSIYEVQLGNQNGSNHILIQASIHGREYINTLLAMEQIEYMLQHYDDGTYNGKTYRQILENMCIHILPMTNPDGVTISQMGLEGIRSSELKTHLEECYIFDREMGRTSNDRAAYYRRWKSNARGVDPNRNFDAGWDTFQSVSHPSFEKYKGTAPASEAEVQAILQVAQNYSVKCVISYHSTGSVIYWDYGSTGDIYQKDIQLADLVSSLTGYQKSSSVSSSQDAAGCSDYFVLKKEIPAVTIENGWGSCPIDSSEFSGIWNSNIDILPALAYTYSLE